MRLDSEGPHLSRESFGPFPFGREFARDRIAFARDGVSFQGDGVSFQGDGVSFQGEFSIGEKSLSCRVDENELPLRAIESHSETGTDPPVHLEDLLEFLSGAFPPVQLKGLGVINIVFLDPMTLVEVELLDHLLVAVPE